GVQTCALPIYRGGFFAFVCDDFGFTEDDDRAVVDRMVKCRAGQHHAVNVSYGHTNIDAARQGPQHPTGRRAVDHKPIADSCETGRDHIWLAFEYEPDVANECRVEDRVDRLAIEMAALGQAFEA